MFKSLKEHVTKVVVDACATNLSHSQYLKCHNQAEFVSIFLNGLIGN